MEVGIDGSGSGDWIYDGAGDQDQQLHVFTNLNVMLTNCSKNVLTQDLQLKIIIQRREGAEHWETNEGRLSYKSQFQVSNSPVSITQVSIAHTSHVDYGYYMWLNRPGG
ncbi:hypothetical protein HanXRQr2_Chr09g0380301 [Helianthus annuus]|uniref:Uncharacterized protein n=1 Tax=Helianthus annuus TaxID=4232 RepID=A0A9K3I5X0_HELAN|nr:hypothetical protein HanXRQr2_Chr09g0380301 [Helianthus annuus]